MCVLSFLLSLSTSLSLSLSPTPSVQWVRKDGQLSESRTTRDMFDRRLRFTDIAESDGGEYQCIANNTQGKIIHTYTVSVEGTSHTHITHFGTHTLCLLKLQCLAARCFALLPRFRTCLGSIPAWGPYLSWLSSGPFCVQLACCVVAV